MLSLNDQSIAIKICGITTPDDAALCARLGAHLIGVVLSRVSRRWVTMDQAREIASVASVAGAAAVGVFVDEDPSYIAESCSFACIQIAQLHGAICRSSLYQQVPDLQCIVALHPAGGGCPEVQPGDIRVYDGPVPGSGQRFDWAAFPPPKEPWILAGGLDAENVTLGLRCLRPRGVDVSSGVCGADPRRKDIQKVAAFIAAIQGGKR